MTFLADKNAPVLEFCTDDSLDMAYAKEKLKNVKTREEEIRKLEEQLAKTKAANEKDLALVARILCPVRVGDIVAPSTDWKEGAKYWEYVVTSIHAVPVSNQERMAKRSAEKSPLGIGVAVRIMKLKKKNRRVAHQGSQVLYLGLSTCNRVGVYEGDLEADLRAQGMYERSQNLEDVPRKKVRSRAADVLS